MIYHLIEASPYTRKFIGFIRRHPEKFHPNEHTFVVYVRQGSLEAHRPEPDNQVIHLTNKLHFFKLLGEVGDADGIVLHGLFSPWLTLALFLRPRAIRRSIWAIWGGDLYFYQYKRGIKDALFELLRKIVLPRLPYVVTFLLGDLDVARTVYGFRGRHLDAFYPNPIDYSRLPSFRSKSSDGPKTFLVGNSAAMTNQHVDALRRLEHFKKENIEVICPLSYGGNAAYVRQVIGVGQAMFGAKFLPVVDYLSAEAYLDLLERVDVAILNFQRQQGLGNIWALIAMGKPVFLRRNTSTYRYFTDKGIDVWDIEALPSTSFDQLPVADEQRAHAGRHFIVETFSESRAARQWQGVFEVISRA